MNVIKIKKTWKGITVTDAAQKQIKYLIQKNKNVEAIQINIKKSGCAGFRYYLSLVYINKDNTLEELYCYQKNCVKIHILKKDMQFLDGTEIDFLEGDGINMSFKFNNPKIQEFCGCGESFFIDEKIK